MEIGDLVRKIKGYGSECKIPMVGVVVDIVVEQTCYPKSFVRNVCKRNC